MDIKSQKVLYFVEEIKSDGGKELKGSFQKAAMLVIKNHYRMFVEDLSYINRVGVEIHHC